MKWEWRKREKNLYLPKDKPELIQIPKQQYFMIRGKGNPNDLDFSERVGVLYSLAYAVRMMPKNGVTPEGYYEYTVYPLEGLWDLTDEGREEAVLNKNELLYTIMIRQPEFVTKEVVEQAFAIVKKKKPNPFLEEVTFEELEDGLSVQIMHTGSYDEEPESFAKLKQYMKDHNLESKSLVHREIYVKANKGNASAEDIKTLKTVLRYRVKKA